MAVVQDNIIPTLSRTTLIRAPDDVRQWTAWPRAILNFSSLDDTISAKPLNDTQELIVSVVLDPSFAYKLVDFNVSLIQDVAQDWDPRGYIEITNGVRNLPAGSTQRHVLELNDVTRIPVPLEMWIMRPGVIEALPRYIIQALSDVATPVVTVKATNNTAAAGAAGTINVLLRFYEYDIEQVQRFPMHYASDSYPR